MTAAREPSQDERRQRYRLMASTGLLMTTTITWRRGDYYSGGLDPTVVAKALLGVIAAVVAWQAARAAGAGLRRAELSLSVPVYLMAYGLLSLFGAWATGGLLIASAVLLARLALIAFTVWQLLVAFEALDVLRTFALWLAAAAALSTVTGSTAGTLKTGAGRLLGGIPPLLPNEIAQLCGLCVLLLLWYDLRGRGRSLDVLGVLALFGVIWLSGSRTTLIFLVVGLLIMIVLMRRFSFGFVVSLLALLPLAVYAGFGTDAAGHYLDRGGSANIGSLSQRTVAWSAALHLHHGFWEVAFGDGLARTSIPVVAQYRTTQILDSTWISALVQGGVVGVAVLAVWVLHTLVRAWRTVGQRRSLYTALAVFVVGLSALESGLIGASPVFVAFLVVGMTGGRRPADDEADPLHAIFRRARASRVAPV